MSKKASKNKSCPCGSGKKFKKCCMNKSRKNRITYVTADLGKPQPINGIKLDPKTGQVVLLLNGHQIIPENASVETGYERTKGLKVLNKVKLPTCALNANPNRKLEEFDLLFAVDTNTKTIGDETISLACVVSGNNVFIPNNTAIRYRPVNCLEFRNIKDKAENIAWVKCIELIQSAPNYKSTLKIGIIVDSDLSNIPHYNSRKQPIYGGFILPENFQLIYASAESGKENIANQMIACCDKEATRLLELIIKHNIVDRLEAVRNQPYTHFKLWVK